MGQSDQIRRHSAGLICVRLSTIFRSELRASQGKRFRVDRACALQNSSVYDVGDGS
jgi:hypothetical protein